MYRSCRVCGALLAVNHRHRHEVRGWRMRYDDLEGALEGYETVAVPGEEQRCATD